MSTSPHLFPPVPCQPLTTLNLKNFHVLNNDGFATMLSNFAVTAASRGSRLVTFWGAPCGLPGGTLRPSRGHPTAPRCVRVASGEDGGGRAGRRVPVAGLHWGSSPPPPMPQASRFLALGAAPCGARPDPVSCCLRRQLCAVPGSEPRGAGLGCCHCLGSSLLGRAEMGSTHQRWGWGVG